MRIICNEQRPFGIEWENNGQRDWDAETLEYIQIKTILISFFEIALM